MVDHLFRREAGRMVATLSGIFGAENLQTAEDAVQETLLLALEIWPFRGAPGSPSGWLFRVARNKMIDSLRRGRRIIHVDFEHEASAAAVQGAASATRASAASTERLDAEGDVLRMMFACCHPSISESSQITLILKTVCGFGTSEIARAFVVSEDTVSKRLFRARELFRKRRVRLELPAGDDAVSRIEAVLNSIYLLFNEGYNSTSSEELIRRDLMDEAVRLCGLLAENPNTQRPEVFALMALMRFHAARTDSRLSPEGEIILLSDQDRNKWDQRLIAEGNLFMNLAASGDSLSRYHLEAAIAYEHCAARTFSETNWEKILRYYELLSQVSPSPFAALNAAVAALCARGPQAALLALESIPHRERLEKYYLCHSLLGEIDGRLNRGARAAEHFATALALTGSEPERRLLRGKIAAAGAAR